MNLDFAKLHALGNDFLIMRPGEVGDLQGSLGSLALRLCNRNRGIGADGVVFYQPTSSDREADVSALIFNADGSRAEVSGNGLRCLAAWLHACGLHTGGTLRVRTVSGIRVLSLKSVSGRDFVYECTMGCPILEAARIPTLLAGVPGQIIQHRLELMDETVKVTVLSLGNPHCSTFWQDVDTAPIERLGPLLERHPVFPSRTNVEFVEVLGEHSIKVRFWERGVGRTLASGTGSSAAAVASLMLGHCTSPVTVKTELGLMTVAWNPAEEVHLTGPAELICQGTCPDAELGLEPA